VEEHPNAKIVREGFDAFLAGDIEWLNEHLHENIVWHSPGSNVLSGDYHGRENVLAFFAKTVQIMRPGFDIHDVLANDDHVVVLLTVNDTRNDNGDTWEGKGASIFHVDAEGRALEVWTLSEDQAGFDAFLQGAGA